LQNRSSFDMKSRYTEAQKAAASTVKKFKEKSWEEFGRGLDSSYSAANKVVWKRSFVYVAKDQISFYPLRILLGTFSVMRMNSY